MSFISNIWSNRTWIGVWKLTGVQVIKLWEAQALQCISQIIITIKTTKERQWSACYMVECRQGVDRFSYMVWRSAACRASSFWPYFLRSLVLILSFYWFPYSCTYLIFIIDNLATWYKSQTSYKLSKTNLSKDWIWFVSKDLGKWAHVAQGQSIQPR